MPGPPSFGEVFGAWGDNQVGISSVGATLWTPSGVVSLHPAGATYSAAHAISGSQQVGEFNPVIFQTHAAVWSGSSGSMIDLHPAGWAYSHARATEGGRQGGWTNTSGLLHAALWSGSAASHVDLDPGVGIGSRIFGMAGGEQVGSVIYVGAGDHAALWRGSAASYVDLNPAGAALSVLNGTCGVAQVGYANLGGVNGAGVWFGTAASFLSIHQYLPPGYGQSVATSVAVENGILYVGGYAWNSASQQEAFLWTGPVPAPGSLALLAGAGILTARRRRP